MFMLFESLLCKVRRRRRKKLASQTTKRGKRAVKVKYLICKDFSNHWLPQHMCSLCCLTQWSQTTRTTMAHPLVDWLKPQSGRDFDNWRGSGFNRVSCSAPRLIGGFSRAEQCHMSFSEVVEGVDVLKAISSICVPVIKPTNATPSHLFTIYLCSAPLLFSKKDAPPVNEPHRGKAVSLAWCWQPQVWVKW